MTMMMMMMMMARLDEQDKLKDRAAIGHKSSNYNLCIPYITTSGHPKTMMPPTQKCATMDLSIYKQSRNGLLHAADGCLPGTEPP